MSNAIIHTGDRGEGRCHPGQVGGEGWTDRQTDSTCSVTAVEGWRYNTDGVARHCQNRASRREFSRVGPWYGGNVSLLTTVHMVRPYMQLRRTTDRVRECGDVRNASHRSDGPDSADV
ncbi:hypothetical protein J6590_082890 [Homalodisca vitripennis]|nr:hypothetical protein J6590_097998 [Homalodisca vitripennis]KAG8255841.1 hypothetical protein J6590_082890 [Homalodisca vitripennis]